MGNLEARLELIDCPLCGRSDSTHWGAENGFSCVKCRQCGLVYVNPRPRLEDISQANEIGEHRTAGDVLHVVYKRSRRKARRYASTIRTVFPDVMASSRPIRWLDVGAGFGELIEVLQELLPDGSRIIGIEPMAPKANDARKRGLPVYQADLTEISERFDVISLINVFSHIPDFRAFLARLRPMLQEHGELFIETGNGGDLDSMRDYPDLLYLPDHLVFAGQVHLRNYLEESGFSLLSTKTSRFDTVTQTGTKLIKSILGREAKLSMPYTSPFRRVFIRARLNEPRGRLSA